MQRKHRFTARFAVGAVVAAAAIIAPSTAATAAPRCESDLCVWSGVNYSGTKTTAGYFDRNTHCYPDGRYNSAISKTGYKLRMYSGSRCNGPSFILKPGQKISDTRFVVHSFKRA
ncbi:peptidase inhibitor family I36 protein [Streptomyces sp. NPDC050658]|uniref:peptidase inhibitor family I36 protein n=1 Tax=unclassified Streptomyces TaxID=2593676 RepID=UPI0034237D5C